VGVAVRTEGLSKHYGRTVALDALDLSRLTTRTRPGRTDPW
jgi:hypothetical protein